MLKNMIIYPYMINIKKINPVQIITLILMVIYVFYGYIFIDLTNTMLFLIISIILFTFSFVISRKNKLLLAIFFILALLFSKITFMVIRDNTHMSNCFIVNESHPLTEKYQDCVKNLTTNDYFKNIFSIK